MFKWEVCRDKRAFFVFFVIFWLFAAAFILRPEAAFADTESVTYYSTQEEAVAALHEQLEAKEENIIIGISYTPGGWEVYDIYNMALTYDDDGCLCAGISSVSTNSVSGSSKSKFYYYVNYYDGDVITCDTAEEAAEVLKEELLARGDGITVHLTYTATSTDAKSIYEATAEHTGVGNEGDYLLFNITSCSRTVNASFRLPQESDQYAAHTTITFSPTYYSTAEEEEAVTEKVSDILGSLKLSGKSDYYKVRKIYDWLTENVEQYSGGTYASRSTAYAAAVNGKANCKGFALLFYRLCLEAGVDARYVSCSAHAWNIVGINGTYYYVDACWDSVNDNKAYSYFLKGTEYYSTLSAHTPEGTTEYLIDEYDVSSDNFTISASSLSVKLAYSSCTYSGNAKEPGVTVTYSGFTLVKNRDYTVSYSNNTNAGTAKATISGLGNISGNTSKSFTINKKDVSGAKITLKTTSFSYDGTVKTPGIKTVTLSGTTLSNSNYTVKYSSGRKSIGTYKVRITGKGNYTGTTTASFKINPAKATVNSLKSSAAKKLTVKWGKVSGSVTGYQVRYKKTTSSTWTVVTVKASTLSKTISGLTAGKKYNVQVRAYKTVDGTKYYGSWSSTKSVTVKKAQTLTVKYSSSKTVKYSKVKSAKQAVTAISKVSGAKGTVTYSKSSGKSYFTVNKSTGKITVKKGTPKGTYTVKVKVSAASTSTYAAASKTVTVKIKIK